MPAPFFGPKNPLVGVWVGVGVGLGWGFQTDPASFLGVSDGPIFRGVSESVTFEQWKKTLVL